MELYNEDNVINYELVGIDHKTTIDAYYKRDIDMELNNSDTVIKALTKLNYYNINYDNENKNYFLKKLTNILTDELYLNWNSDIKNKTINQILDDIKESKDYSIFNDNLNYRINRNLQLEEYIQCIDIYYFYNALTLQELNYLGY
jgi:hypothetical protein